MPTAYIPTRRDLDEAVLDAVREILPWAIEQLELPEPDPAPEILSNRRAREYLDVSKSTLQRWRDSGLLPYSKIEGSIYYRREDLIRVVEEHRVNGNS